MCCTDIKHVTNPKRLTTLGHVTYLPLLFCMLGLAPALSRASAIRAMLLITSAECFLGLNEQTK